MSLLQRRSAPPPLQPRALRSIPPAPVYEDAVEDTRCWTVWGGRQDCDADPDDGDDGLACFNSCGLERLRQAAYCSSPLHARLRAVHACHGRRSTPSAQVTIKMQLVLLRRHMCQEHKS